MESRQTKDMSDWRNYIDTIGSRAHTVRGTLKVLQQLRSPQLGNRRDILVYLPPSYATSEKRYPVVYMHDGQNLFDAAASFCGEWKVDETLEAASATGLEAIVVGIPNTGTERLNEYSPFADPRRGGGKGDRYLRFVVDTLKPRIDRDFRTLTNRENTGIMGSSMGGLISLYAYFRYTDVFGFVGAMSPSIWFAARAIVPYIQRAPLVAGRIYLDMGTAEGAFMLADAQRMEALLQRKGYRLEHNLRFVEAKDAPHSETAWSMRFGPALEFLLKHVPHPALLHDPRMPAHQLPGSGLSI